MEESSRAQKLIQAFMQKREEERASMPQKRVLSVVETCYKDEDEQLSSSSESGDNLNEDSIRSYQAEETCPKYEIKAEVFKQLSSEAEHKLRLKREFKDEERPKTIKLYIKVELPLNC